MAVNGKQPFIHVSDANGKPIVGAVLKVYEVGTTTNRAIFSDAGLTTPFTNPLSGVNASNAAGDFPVFYMAAGLYKLRAETSTGVPIWEWDNLDTGTSAGAGALPISGGGTGATTATAALANLGGASTSDVTALAAQIATFTASLQSLTSNPQGRLTLTSGVPVLSTGVTAGTAVFYTPYIGNVCPVWNGTLFILKIFAELTLTLNASYVLNSIYDCFIINDAVDGVKIVTGPAWTTITAGLGARGSGAGTTELTRLNGLLVNANAMATARNGATTYAVAINQGTYVGSIYIDGTAGQITCHTAYGQSRKWGVWNAYNRKMTAVIAGDATASWNNTSAAVRNSNGNAANVVTTFSGLPEDMLDVDFVQQMNLKPDPASALLQTIRNGIGFNGSGVFSGSQGTVGASSNAGGAVSSTSTATARLTTIPVIGINSVFLLEQGNSAASVVSLFFGTSSNMVLSAKWLT